MFEKWSKNGYGCFCQKYFFEDPLEMLFFEFYEAVFQCCAYVARHVATFDDDRVFR